MFFFFFSVTEPVKTLAKLFHHSLLLSSVLPPCSPFLLYTSSVPDLHTHCFARFSSFALHPGALIIGPLISAKTILFQLARLSLSPFSCFPAVCPFLLSSLCFILLSLCCRALRVVGSWVEGVLIWPRAVSPTEPYGARLMWRRQGRAERLTNRLCAVSEFLVVVWINKILYPEKKMQFFTRYTILPHHTIPSYHASFLQMEQGRNWGRLNPIAAFQVCYLVS